MRLQGSHRDATRIQAPDSAFHAEVLVQVDASPVVITHLVIEGGSVGVVNRATVLFREDVDIGNNSNSENPGSPSSGIFNYGGLRLDGTTVEANVETQGRGI